MLIFWNLEILSWEKRGGGERRGMTVIQRTSHGRLLIIDAILFYKAINYEERQ